MEFIVPKFIEEESKIIGPLSFKQFVFVGAGAVMALVFYFILPTFLFFLGAVASVGGGLALAFYKIDRTPLPTYIGNMFVFMFKPKIYLWDKKPGSAKFFVQDKKVVKELAKKPTDEKPSLKVSKGSRLGDLSIKLETR